MKRQIVFATAFSAALAVGAAAQTGSQAQQERPQQQQSQRGEQVTMTGCLERSTSGTAGTTGTTGTSGQAGFILTDAERSGASGTSGTAGTTGTPPSRSTMGGDKYRLMGGDREDLQKYLNSKVEIRGTLDKSSMSGSGAATGTGTAGTRAGQQEEDKLPVLRVTSVRQVSPTCDK